MALIEDLLETRKRFEHWSRQQQAAAATDDDQVEATMLNRRADFMAAGDRVFFERILAQSDLMPIRYLALGQLAARPVGRIRVNVLGEGEGYATGFLVAPGLLLTNWHVLKRIDYAQSASVSFDAEDDLASLPKPTRTFVLQPDEVFLSDEKLDICFVGVTPRSVEGVPLAEYGYLRLFDGTGKITRGEYATVIQHPNGRQKHIAVRENRIIVYVYDGEAPVEEEDNDFLYYTTDTSQGSSGSPVFSDQWYVVALHRAGVPKTTMQDGRRVILRVDGTVARDGDPDSMIAYEANEGIRVSRIFRRLQAISQQAGGREQALRVLERLGAVARDAGEGPFDRTLITRNLQPLGSVQGHAASAEELVRRSVRFFPEGAGYGYDPMFLRHPLPLPQPRPELARELAPRIDQPDEVLLPFRHFTTCMHARRRLPVFAAVNLSAHGKPASLGARPKWSIDPRIDEGHQPDDSLFSRLLQRGHMAARDHVVWGATQQERTEADRHSFTLTNVCPQLAAFNGAGGEWWKIERCIDEALESSEDRCCVFMGPVFRADDQDYDDLRGEGSSAEWGTGIRIPTRFWMVLAWVVEDDLVYRAFFLDQGEELRQAGPLEFDFAPPTGVREVTLKQVERATDLSFEWED